MTPDALQEQALIDASRLQRERLERWARVSLDAGEFEQAEKLRREAMSAETYSANVDLLRRRIAKMKGNS